MRLASLLLLALAASQAAAQDTKEQIIDADCEFSADLEVKKDWKLVIKPGVTIKFAPGVGIICRGIIDARGSLGKPVKFMPREPEKGWGNIALLAPGSDGSSFEGCRFTGARGRIARFSIDNEFKELGKAGDGKTAALTVIAGGALFVCGDARAEVTNCKFEENSAEWGGAVAVFNKARVQLVNCDFRANRAVENGGAVVTVACEVFFNKCVFAGNFSKHGGAIQLRRGATSAIEKSWFGVNGAGGTGGAISCYDRGCPTIENCWINRNNASLNGGAVAATGDSKVILRMSYIEVNKDITGERKGLWMNGEDWSGHADTSQIIEETQGGKVDVEKVLENNSVMRRLKSIPEAKDLK